MRRDHIPYTNYHIFQDPAYFAYGTDALALLAFSKAKGRVLDMGAGTGILAMGIAARAEVTEVVAVERQVPLADLMQKSIALNQLEKKVHVVCGDLKTIDLGNEVYDAVLTNPPYFEHQDGQGKSLESHMEAKKESMPIGEWIRIAAKPLKFKGSFEIVHRPHRLVDILVAMRTCGLEPKEIQIVYGKDEGKLLLIRGRKGGKPGVKIVRASSYQIAQGVGSSGSDV